MARKLKTMELDFWFELAPGSSEPSDGAEFIDLAQVTSLVNRVFIRQGQQIAIQSVEVVGDGDSLVTIRRLPYHWSMANAWDKSYEMWQRSQDQVLDIEPSLAARYRDFKVYYNIVHKAAGVGANLLPIGYAIAGADSVYDWDMSTIQIPNNAVVGTTDEFDLHVLGDSTAAGAGDSKGLIHGYALSRSRPQSEEPNVADPRGWMNQLFDDGDNLDEIRTDIEDNNDSPPYLIGTEGSAVEYYPGGAAQGSPLGEIECSLATRSSFFSATQYGKGFLAPCGLLSVGWSYGGSAAGAFPSGLYLRVTVAAGSAKGIMARPMKEMN